MEVREGVVTKLAAWNFVPPCVVLKSTFGSEPRPQVHCFEEDRCIYTWNIFIW